VRARAALRLVIARLDRAIQGAALSRFNLRSLEYWITRRSLSSGAHSRDPLAGDDSCAWFQEDFHIAFV
jgi:hypothetical protein